MTVQDSRPPTEELVPPRFVDEELAQKLAVRGNIEGAWGRKVSTGIFVLCLLFGIVIGYYDLPFLPGLAVIFGTGCLVGIILQTQLLEAFNRRQYDLVTKRAPAAIVWNMLFRPVTNLQFNACINTQFMLLMVEGRNVELEAVSRYAWALNERKVVTTGTPKHWAIANNLAVSLLNQWRYEEAASLLTELLSRVKQKNVRVYLHNNLAFCSIKQHKLEAAEAHLAEGFALHGKKDSIIGVRLKLIKSLVETEKKNFDQAEKVLLETQAMAVRLHETVEFQAGCDSVMGEIRFQQNRLDEAELYYKNALSIYESGQNPSYIVLMQCLYDYARVLDAAGKESAAAKAREHAQTVRSIYCERETRTVESIKTRLADPKHIWVGSQLTSVAARMPLLNRTSD